ncbi:MAG TPA: long-chain fatty acid--CoA ligase [Candidatus Binatia bacterium]|nr:long-chain fatty acid--CoA ligase [Candidatus Binatia bacterium]
MNVAHHVSRAARWFPEHPALRFEGAALSYRDLDARSTRLANALAAHGIGRGDRVALYLPNIPEFAVCYTAVLKAGGVAVSINAIFKSEEVKFILGDSGARVVFTTGDLAPGVPVAECPALERVIVCEGDAAGQPVLADWIARGAASGRPLDMARDEPAVLLYTSGTTGFPKGATLSHGNVIFNDYACAHHMGVRQSDRLLLFLPLFHVFGQNAIMNAAFAACATVVLHRRFVPDQVLAGIARERATMFFAVPTIFINLLAMDLERHDLSSIRYEFSAAATMPQEISRRWTERFGRPVFEGYGLTECSPFAAYNHDFRHKLGSVGTPVENTDVRILDDDGGEVPPGTWGEICIQGPGVMQGYWGRPEDTARAIRGGWLRSGDIGTMDDEGYVFIVDRVKDMINVSGFKVWPAEVEQALYRHPAIREVAVYGVGDPVKGEAVKAAIILKAGASATPEEIIAFCRERLAVYKAPGAVDIVDELPKSATGKILKRVLRAR